MPTKDRTTSIEIATENYILSTNPVLYIPLYELDGGSFMSKDAYGHLATVTGATWGSQGRTFVDASLDKVVVPDTASLDITGDLTLEVWVKFSSLPAGNRFLINKWESNSSDKAYMLLTTSSQISFLIRNAANDAEVEADSVVGALVIDTWYHIVGVHSGNTMYIYKNAVQDVNTGTIGTGRVSANELRLGNYVTTSGLGGLIGEVRIYNRALSAVELLHNHLATRWRYQ